MRERWANLGLVIVWFLIAGFIAGEKKMTQYFLVKQSGLTDNEPDIIGPYKSIKDVTKMAEEGFELEPGNIYTVLKQEDGNFTQALQAKVPDSTKLAWNSGIATTSD